MQISGLFVSTALLCLPPILLAGSGYRRLSRRRQAGMPGRTWIVPGLWSVAGVLSVLAVLVLIVPHWRAAGTPLAGFSRSDAIAGILSWLCLWAWLLTGPLRIRRRGRSRRPIG